MDQHTNSPSNVDKYIDAFVRCRDELRRLKEKYEADCEQYKNLQNVLEGKLLKFLGDHKLKNLRTVHGTCYTSTRWNAPLQDKDLFRQFVIANHAWDMLDWRANAEAVKDFIATKNAPVPGCGLTSITHVGVRRGKGETED